MGKASLICLITTLDDPRTAPAQLLADTYHERWEHETANKQLKTHLRGPGRVLRSKNPDMVRQDIYGYLLSPLRHQRPDLPRATEADIDPGPVKFKRTVRLVRRHLTAAITHPRNLNPKRRHRTYPRVVKRARHNSYRVKRSTDNRHPPRQATHDPAPTPPTHTRSMINLD